MSNDEYCTANQIQYSPAKFTVEVVTEVRPQGENEPLSMVTHVLNYRTIEEVKELLNKIHLWVIDR